MLQSGFMMVFPMIHIVPSKLQVFLLRKLIDAIERYVPTNERTNTNYSDIDILEVARHGLKGLPGKYMPDAQWLSHVETANFPYDQTYLEKLPPKIRNMAGRQEGAKNFYSICHGAGRLRSRKATKALVSVEEFQRSMKVGLEDEILVNHDSLESILDECPQAYKDVDDIIDSVVGAELADVVAKCLPLAVVKGR